VTQRHDCLILRFPGAREFQWTLLQDGQPERFAISGPFDSDDGDVLTGWALGGHGVVLKPVFEVAEHLESGALIPVASLSPPLPVTLACLYAHRRHQDPKTRLFIDLMAKRIRRTLKALEKNVQLPL
jgi:DNA-binding transcriptional LysR family regulator